MISVHDTRRWALRVTPIAGFLSVVLILFFLVDPPRGHSEGSLMKSTSLRDDAVYLVEQLFPFYYYVTMSRAYLCFKYRLVGVTST